MSIKVPVLDLTKSIAIIVVVLFLWFHGSNFITGLNNNNTVPKEVLTQLSDNMLVLQNIVASNKEAKQLIKELELKNGEQAVLLAEVKKNNKLKGAKMDEVGVIVSELSQQVNLLNKASDHIYKPDDPALSSNINYFKKIYVKDKDGNSFPVAWAQFYPERAEGDRWKTGSYPIEYHVTIVETESDDNILNRYAEVHIENNQMKETKGKEYPIVLTDIKWEKFENRIKKFYFWNPRIGLGSYFMADSVSVGLDLSMSSYGITKRDMDWRFLVFGFGILNETDGVEGIFSFEPVSWNLGNVVPVVENLFIGPTAVVDTDLNYNIGLKLAIPF